MLTSCLMTFTIRISDASMLASQKKTTRHNINHNKWITTGIRKSCNRKRELFLLRRDSNDINLKIYFKQYCEILTNVILAAKKLHYCRIIANSNNK